MERGERTDCEAVLRSVDIFADFPEEFLRRLAAVSELMEFPAGTVIVKQGDPATAFFAVTKGMLEVSVDQQGRSQAIASLHPGQFFGEMALLTKGNRMATVRATDDVECLVLEKHAFDAELHRDPNAAAVLATRMARRVAGYRRQV